MGLQMNESKAGLIVYQPYNPRRVGRIVDVYSNEIVTVEWMEGQQSLCYIDNLNSLEALVQAQETTLINHKARLAAAKERWK